VFNQPRLALILQAVLQYRSGCAPMQLPLRARHRAPGSPALPAARRPLVQGGRRRAFAGRAKIWGALAQPLLFYGSAATRGPRQLRAAGRGQGMHIPYRTVLQSVHPPKSSPAPRGAEHGQRSAPPPAHPASGARPPLHQGAGSPLPRGRARGAYISGMCCVSSCWISAK